MLDPLTDDQADVCDEGLEWKTLDEFVCIEDRMCGDDGEPPCQGALYYLSKTTHKHGQGNHHQPLVGLEVYHCTALNDAHHKIL